MLSYDSQIIYRFADRLYRQANSTVAAYTLVGLLVGVLVPYVGLSHDVTLTVIGGFALGGIGFIVGSQRAFALRLQAQTALCQVRIEENTRMARQSASSGAEAEAAK